MKKDICDKVQRIIPFRGKTNSEEENLKMKLAKKIQKNRRDFRNSLTLHEDRKFIIEEGGCEGNCNLAKDKCICTFHSCAKTFGYFTKKDIKLFTTAERKEIRRLFDKKDGFLRENGCILPRHLRSTICLAYVCFYDKNLERYLEIPSFKKCYYFLNDMNYKFCKEIESRIGSGPFMVTDRQCDLCDKDKKSFLNKWEQKIKNKSTFICKVLSVAKDLDKKNNLFEKLKKKYL